MASASTSAVPAPAPKAVPQKAIAKIVMSGDSVVIRGQPKGGPPPEKTIGISNIIAPKLGRRPQEGTAAVKDEPFAWEAREFLRKKIIGQEVHFVVDYKVPSTGREFGYLFLPRGSGEEPENLAETLVSEGLVEVRLPPNNRPADEYLTRLLDLQTSAKSGGKGKWGPDAEVATHVRDVQWTHDNPRHLVDSMHQQPCKAVIEHVRDGSTVRAFLLPDMHHVTLMISGIKCPIYRVGTGGEVMENEAYAEEARYFTEVRLLQRDVEIVLESVSNQNFIGTVLHPNGNIAELLLKEGFAKCVDWSMAIVTGGPDALRSAEKQAKEKKLRIWRNYEPAAAMSGTRKSFQATVCEIIMGDSMMVKKETGEVLKVSLSSIRLPRPEDAGSGAKIGEGAEGKAPLGKENQVSGRSFRPLYDIPFMFEAREFLRKRLIGKTVNITIDYVQPAANNFPERLCCTVLTGQQNVAEALVLKGLATVVRYRQDDENRSGDYDLLLAAEAKAEKSTKGIHALKAGALGNKLPVVRVQDMQGDVNKSRQFFPHLQRAGRCEGVVEFVSSGSRVRVYVPKQTCLLTFLLSGISCPRSSRPMQGQPQTMVPGEPYGDEALLYTKSRVLQREIELEVEGMDKGGNFVGWLFCDGVNMSEALVKEGLASVHFTAERTNYYGTLQRAEQHAKDNKLNMWKDFVDTAADEEAERVAADNKDRTVAFKRVMATECTNAQPLLKFAAQGADDGPQLESMMRELRDELVEHPPVKGALTARRGDMCAAKYVDGEWYRGKIESVQGPNAQVLFIDFGNRETLNVTESMAALPPAFHSQPAGAREYALALVALSPKAEPESHEAAAQALRQLLLTNQPLAINVEYRVGGVEFVTAILGADPKAADAQDAGKTLIQEGHAVVEPRRERRLAKLVQDYTAAQKKAQQAHLNIWQYGDFMGDDDL